MLAADTVSILTMEVVGNLVMWLVPGAMDAGLLDAFFWGSMAVSLVIAYFAAYPVNKALLHRDKGHAITHRASGGGPMDNRPLAYGISASVLGGFVSSPGTLLQRATVAWVAPTPQIPHDKTVPGWGPRATATPAGGALPVRRIPLTLAGLVNSAAITG